MFSKLRTRLTYANVVATLALFLALTGGTAVALTGSNTVFSDDITNNEVRTADVRNDNLSGGGLVSGDIRLDALTGSDVRALTGADVNDNSLTGSDVNESTLSGVLKNAVVRQGTPFMTSTVAPTNAADCADGEVAIGGGAQTSGSNGGVPVISESKPGTDTAGGPPVTWDAVVRNVSSSGTITATPVAICSKP